MPWTNRIWISLAAWELYPGDLVAKFGRWRQRARSRRDLLWLSEDQLRDIGIDRYAALEEAHKPFWRP